MVRHFLEKCTCQQSLAQKHHQMHTLGELNETSRIDFIAMPPFRDANFMVSFTIPLEVKKFLIYPNNKVNSNVNLEFVSFLNFV